MHFIRHRAAYGRKGAILIMVMAVFLLLSLMSIGLLSAGGMAGIETSHAVTRMQAYWAAEAGVQQAVALGQFRRIPYEYYDRPSGSWGNYLWGSNVLSGTTACGRYSVDVLNDPSWTNPVHALKKYIVTSHGVSLAGDKQTITLSAAIMSFASYLHATNLEKGSDGTLIYFMQGDILNGPVYVNDQLNIDGGSPNPSFLQLASSAASSVNYINGATSNVFQGGLALNVLPLDIAGTFTSDHVRDVQIEAQRNGGLVLTNGNYQFVFNQNGQFTYQTGTISGSPPAISLSGPIITNNLTAWTNGMPIYVQNSAFVRGTVNGKATLAAGNSIYIATNLVYQSATNPPPPWTGANGFNVTNVNDTLGLIASNQIMVTSRIATEIHAALMVTSGDMGFNAYYNNTSIGNPYLKIFGGITEYRRGIVKKGNNGFQKNYQFDNRFLTEAPPFFPYSLYVFTTWGQSTK